MGEPSRKNNTEKPEMTWHIQGIVVHHLAKFKVKFFHFIKGIYLLTFPSSNEWVLKWAQKIKYTSFDGSFLSLSLGAHCLYE